MNVLGVLGFLCIDAMVGPIWLAAMTLMGTWVLAGLVRSTAGRHLALPARLSPTRMGRVSRPPICRGFLADDLILPNPLYFSRDWKKPNRLAPIRRLISTSSLSCRVQVCPES